MRWQTGGIEGMENLGGGIALATRLFLPKGKGLFYFPLHLFADKIAHSVCCAHVFTAEWAKFSVTKHRGSIILWSKMPLIIPLSLVASEFDKETC